jgi:hypothetical protein
MTDNKFLYSFNDLPLNAEVYLYGASNGGERTSKYLKFFRKDISIKGFLDSYQSGQFIDMAVTTIDEAPVQWFENSIILITSMYWVDISQALKSKNIQNYRVCSDELYALPNFPTAPLNQLRYEVKCFGTDEIKKALALSVQYIYGAEVEGDVAEFGTQTGFSSSVLAASISAFDGFSKITGKKLHLFDSFEGFPAINNESDQASPQIQSGVWGEGFFKGLSAEQLVLNIISASNMPLELIEVYPGWYSDTVPKLADSSRFALLHIDCDLYQSTMDVLDVCFSKNYISTGAMICFDDWNCNRAMPDHGERKAWAEIIEKYQIDYSNAGSYSWSGQRFIVHQYQSPKN